MIFGSQWVLSRIFVIFNMFYYCIPHSQNGRLEGDLVHYTERNNHVDRILQSVMKSAGMRKVILCSFDPDVCVM